MELVLIALVHSLSSRNAMLPESVTLHVNWTQ